MVQGLLICFTVFLHVLECPLCQSHWKLLPLEIIARLFFFRSTFMMFLVSAAPFAVARFLDTQARTSHRQDEFYLGAQFTAEALSRPAMHAQGVHGGSISLW